MEAGAGGVSLRFYSERDLAAVLGVSVKTVQGWRFRGQGPAWKKLAGARNHSGGTVRYPIDQFNEWWQGQPGGGGVR
jgi:transposase